MSQWGWVSGGDREALLRGVEYVCSTFPDGVLRFLDIGTGTGETSRALRDAVAKPKVRREAYGVAVQRGREVEYHCIDNGEGECGWDVTWPPFPEAICHLGDSADDLDVPFALHWVFVDGCHCRTHVKNDFQRYGVERLLPGGVIAFHDTLQEGATQGDHVVEVQSALRELGLPNAEWALLTRSFEVPGTDVYVRVL